LKLPTDPKEFVAILGTELDAAYQRTLDGLRRDDPIFAIAEGRIDLEKLDALDEPSSLRALRARIDAMLPDVELPELCSRSQREPGSRPRSRTSESRPRG
jgi:hypothetical protein